MINSNIFLIVDNAGVDGDIYTKSSDHASNLGYIAKCEGVNLTYWCNYINNELPLWGLCLYW
jgi:hypothetical protein